MEGVPEQSRNIKISGTELAEELKNTKITRDLGHSCRIVKK